EKVLVCRRYPAEIAPRSIRASRRKATPHCVLQSWSRSGFPSRRDRAAPRRDSSTTSRCSSGACPECACGRRGSGYRYLRGRMACSWCRTPGISAQGCEPAQRLEPRQKEVGTPAKRREGRQASNLPANGALRDLEFERSVVSSSEGVALVSELVEVTIVHPDVLRELKLPDEARADDECGEPALLAIVRGALRKMRSIGRTPTDQAVSVHVRCCIARVHASHVGPKRYRITLRVLGLIVEIIITLRVSPELGVVLLGREHQGGATAPAAHEFRSEEFLLFRRFAVLAQEFAEPADVLLEAPVGH